MSAMLVSGSWPIPVAIGIRDAHLDQHGYVYATIPANTDKKVPVICFCSHMDTSPDCSGKDVKPQIVRNYRGGDIVARRNTLIAMDGETEIRTPYDDCLLVMPSLRPSRGHTAVRGALAGDGDGPDRLRCRKSAGCCCRDRNRCERSNPWPSPSRPGS